MSSPYYDLVPRDPVANLQWRIRCRERALVDKRFRDILYQACMEDVCFWMAFGCYGYDPRARFKVVPFIPYPHQESVFVAMDDAIDTAEREERSVDVILDKARAQGGTFGYLWVDLRRWLRDPMFSAGYVTRNEDLIDSKSDSSTVLWKVAWAIEKLPFWMRPNYERHLGHHTFINNDNGALLRGYSAGQDVAAGGRATVFTVDEAGARDFVAAGKDEAVQESIQDVTNCLAAGTLVVTDQGLVPIEAVELHHRVWDGTMWVAHEGCVYQGEQETISSYGINLTPDHLVFTTRGWKHACERHDRAAIRAPDGSWEKWLKQGRYSEVAMPMRLRRGIHGDGKQVEDRGHHELWVRKTAGGWRQDPDSQHDGNANVCVMDGNEVSVQQLQRYELRQVWWALDLDLQEMGIIREFPGGHGRKARKPQGNVYRADRQRWGLRTRQLPLGDSRTAGEQPKHQQAGRQPAREDDNSRTRKGSRIDGRLCKTQSQEGRYGGCLAASTPPKTPVYDLLNCGPKAAFTVIDGSGRPLLVHNCVRMVSARYTDQGVFHEACENPDTAVNGVHLVLDWKDHPVHSKHSYIVRSGVPVAINPDDQAEVSRYHAETPNLRSRLERKGFKYEDRVRSPWYDMRCLRPTATPRLIASQLDRSPREAVGKVFASDLLDRMKRQHCKSPVWIGNPVFDAETCKLTGLIPREDGLLKLWFRPGLDDSPPLGPFTAGCDIASGGVGAYSSNSVMSVLDDRTGEQVLEYTIKGLEPRPFARRVVGLCMWLRNALLGWEDSGVSGGFAKEIMEVIYYGNVFYRDVTQLGSQKKSRKPGWPCRDADKADMFEQMALAMEQGKFTPRSEEMITECGEYEWDGSKIVHAPSKNKGASDKNHADRSIASAGAWMVFSTDNAVHKIDTDEETGHIPEYGSFLWREQQERRVMKSGSPGYGLRDVVGY